MQRALHMLTRARIDRSSAIPAIRAKFNHSQILIKYNLYLSSKDSDVDSLLDKANLDLESVASSLLTKLSLHSSNHSGLRRPPFRRKPRAPTSTRVNLIDMQNPLASVECPSDMTAVQCYESALNAIKAEPFKFSSHTTPCAVCDRIGHPFEDCEVLRNVDFLRKHHI